MHFNFLNNFTSNSSNVDTSKFGGESETISYLRFPLIVLVVMIHSKFDGVVVNGVGLMHDGGFPCYSTISTLVSNIIASIAVPLFYFISGFLFFFKTAFFSFDVYCSKIKKRAKTILIPYLCWNLFVILLLLAAESVFPGLLSGKNKLVVDYTFTDWLWSFYDTSHINPTVEGAFPICYQFWFLRDLMVTMVFSPIVYLGVRYLKVLFILCLGILWLINFLPAIPGFSSAAMFYFSFGAYFSIHKKDFVATMRPLLPLSLLAYLLLVSVRFIPGCMNSWYIEYVYHLSIILGMLCMIAITSYLLCMGKIKSHHFLTNSSFFIYAFHSMPLVLIIKLLFKAIQPQSDFTICMLYFLCPAITIVIGLGLYKSLVILFPKFTAIITGGRK